MEVKKFTCLQAQCMSSSMSFAPRNNLKTFYIECGSEFLLNTVDCLSISFLVQVYGSPSSRPPEGDAVSHLSWYESQEPPFVVSRIYFLIIRTCEKII
jgi:hypothetical protein